MRARLLAMLIAAPLLASSLAGCDAATSLLVPITTGATMGTGGSGGSLAIIRTSADPSKTNVAKGETLKLTVEANRMGVNFYWTASGGDLNASGSSATWTAPSSAGTYTVNVRANDGTDEASAAFRFTVK
jgi:hypothetical protein